MEIEIFQAFTSAGVADEKAQRAVDSIRKEIDERYRAHVEDLVTQKDLAMAVARLETSIGTVSSDLKLSNAGHTAHIDLSIARLGIQIAESGNQTIRWTIGTMIAIVALSFAAAKTLWG